MLVCSVCLTDRKPDSSTDKESSAGRQAGVRVCEGERVCEGVRVCVRERGDGVGEGVWQAPSPCSD